MKEAIVLSGGTIDYNYAKTVLEQHKHAYLIGVDGGCKVARDLKFVLDLMIGDFDTLEECVFFEVKETAKECIILNPVKDQTDTHATLDYLLEHGFERIFILGGQGTRFDHTLANIYTAMKYAPTMSIQFLDPNNKIQLICGPARVVGPYNDTDGRIVNKEACTVTEEGLKALPLHKTLEISALQEYKYLSVIPLEPTYVLSTRGLKYPIKEVILNPYNSYAVSNEVVSEMVIVVDYGKALVIASRD